ncbi:pre-mRNA processing factor 3-domain-containing protein [Ochromonadaceae sp. CCMP2298]|nr:pre-mRNA processing factor 3-domain-containing protein [Ochromonadaceae sp. CCMP2298]
MGMGAEPVLDDRLKLASRDVRARKSLHFVEAGRFIGEEQRLRAFEERKAKAGYASGRKNIEQAQAEKASTDEGADAEKGGADIEAEEKEPSAPLAETLPPSSDLSVPLLEWWDEAFLPRERREAARKVARAVSSSVTAGQQYNEDDPSLLALQHARTYRLLQHPVPVKPLSGERGPAPALPMFLTKHEQKKLRRSTRHEREQEKRDKMMMGLIPAPEPKFKLSNFMKVLGDQAVADPSKVELRVLQQMQQRVLNHEMRNQAAKLTPQEKREKKLRKLQEDVSRGVSVAVFRVSDFASLKLRYKVDVNAQQLFLSGIVLLCAEAGTAGTGGRNLVVAEGGPRGIRKFVRLMTERIKWASDEGGVEEEEEGSDDDDEEEEGEEGEPSASSASGAGGGGGGSAGAGGGAVCNRCDLLWQGLLPKRGFTGFRFQEAASAAAAKKLLRLRGCAHYWDMVEGADNMLASSAALALF